MLDLAKFFSFVLLPVLTQPSDGTSNFSLDGIAQSHQGVIGRDSYSAHGMQATDDRDFWVDSICSDAENAARRYATTSARSNTYWSTRTSTYVQGSYCFEPCDCTGGGAVGRAITCTVNYIYFNPEVTNAGNVCSR
jgi:hypothetical protein